MRLSIVLLLVLLVPAVSMSAVFVTNTADSGPGSLRSALAVAMGTIGPDTIRFNIPLTDPAYVFGTGTWTIYPQSDMRVTANGITIDGSSQARFIGGDPNPDGPEIHINGKHAPGEESLNFYSCDSVRISDLIITNFRNNLYFEQSKNITIEGCFIGTDPTGHAPEKSDKGITLTDCQNIVIGSPDPQRGNVISGNSLRGVSIYAGRDVVIQSNKIGVDQTGLHALLNGNVAVELSGLLGGIHILNNQVAAANIGIQLGECSNALISANIINTDSSFQQDLGGGTAILLDWYSNGNHIDSNTVMFSEQAVVIADSSQRNTLSKNRISGNTVGIILSNEGNNQIAAPVLAPDGGNPIAGAAGPGDRVQFFSDDADQGEFYLGETFADEAGQFKFALRENSPRQNITAIATDAAGNSSEFSAPVKANWQPLPGAAKFVTNTLDSGPGSLRNALELAMESDGPDSIRFNIPITDPGYNADAGTWMITPTNTMVVTANDLVIDGASQADFIGSDANPVGPEIVIDGRLAPGGSGFYFITCRSIVVQNLVVTNFAENLDFNGSDFITVAGCYLGTDALGQSAGETSGLGLYAYDCRNVTVGADTKSRGNLISGNTNRDILLGSCSNCRIENNRIGVDRTGQMPLHRGYEALTVQSGSDSTVIIGNQVAGTNFSIRLLHAAHTTIRNNTINTDSTFQKDLGDGAGMLFQDRSNDNLILENNISFCQRAIVIADTSLRNTISKNRITGNQQAVILNEGGNNMISAPVLTAATRDGVFGTAGPNQTVQVFADSTNQGEIFLGETTSDASGAFHLDFDHTPERPNVTAIATDAEGNSSAFSWAMMVTGVDDYQTLSTPDKFSVSDGYPNPFNPQTTVQIALPKDEQVTAALYDLLGRRVRLLLDEPHPAGIFALQWDGKNDAGSPVPSGVYLLQCRTHDKVEIRKLMLIR